MKTYEVIFECKFSGLYLCSGDGFYNSTETTSLKKARKILADWRRKYWGNNGFCSCTIWRKYDGEPDEIVYSRKYGKLN